MKALGKGSIASIVRIGLMFAWYALWVAAIGVVCGAIGYGVILTLIANGSIDPALLQGGAGNAELGSGGGDFHITYDQPGGGAWPVVVPALLIAAVAVAGSLIIVWRLRKLFDSFSSGEPFQRENATHLRVIWITMLVIEVSRYVLMALTGFLLAHFGGPDVNANYELSVDLSTWGSILILIVLAEVFREGARLKEEQELTI
ncbi:DUF2975 domain-containing protein [Candidatus Viadribacter manganicus]|uniref:DUF2975 domain-containing protein n=1 Tax=Candidatus Viadribacter manganicus TaxID=1759059 RepID=A0A1B1AI71_9PROT|nr:DUF2975 domain-containing protein [Candidatus Viadribacter manganicus]ANP46263.1 hypothetical protein ATE48_10215 [Candidatus Viadribacter manganicus]